MAKHLFLTGEKRIGKSVLLKKLLAEVNGVVGGFYTVRTREVFPDDGFTLHLIRAGTTETPSRENYIFTCGMPDEQVPERFARLGCGALDASGNADILVMDELGPNEARALTFQQAVRNVLDGEIPVLGVLQKADTPFLREIAAHPQVRVMEVRLENRDALFDVAAAYLKEWGLFP